MQWFSIKDLYSFAVIFPPLLYYFKKHFESLIIISLLFEKILFNFTVDHLSANIPISVIITRISSLKE